MRVSTSGGSRLPEDGSMFAAEDSGTRWTVAVWKEVRCLWEVVNGEGYDGGKEVWDPNPTRQVRLNFRAGAGAPGRNRCRVQLPPPTRKKAEGED